MFQAVQPRVGLMTSLGLSFSRTLPLVASSLRGQWDIVRKIPAQHLAHSRHSAISFLFVTWARMEASALRQSPFFLGLWRDQVGPDFRECMCRVG